MSKIWDEIFCLNYYQTIKFKKKLYKNGLKLWVFIYYKCVDL